jgi:hypothetical protein
MIQNVANGRIDEILKVRNCGFIQPSNKFGLDMDRLTIASMILPACSVDSASSDLTEIFSSPYRKNRAANPSQSGLIYVEQVMGDMTLEMSVAMST